MAKIILIAKIDAPEQCQFCGQYLIKPYLQTFGETPSDNAKFCAMHCVNQYFDTEKIRDGEIVFKEKNGNRH